jgi:NAD(P)-dependent dehydrogenase (short-subunit alcohol dehydrogenase family)
MGNVVVVTGAAGGIGRALSAAFAAEGASLVLGDMDATGGAALVDELRSGGAEASFEMCDVRSSDDVGALVAAAMDRHGRIDVAVNNAGITHLPADTADFDVDEFDRIVAVNLRGVFLGLRHELPVMIAQGSGTVLNIASVLGLTGFAGAAAYCAAKHGVVGLTRVAALETAQQGVRVNAICPGFIETPMVTVHGLAAARGTETFDQIAALHPMARMGQPEEIARAAVFAASAGASFMTGHALVLDGGFLAQ